MFWKSELIDFVILQQDAFDDIDSVSSMERQEDIVNMVMDICHAEFEFDTFLDVMNFFKRVINVCKQINYSEYKSDKYNEYMKQLEELVASKKK